MKKCFDQFKVNAIKVRIVPLDMATVNNSNLQSAICWDRNGAGVQNLTWDKLCTYGSCKLNYYTPGAKTTQIHWIAAETIGEKTSYVPCETPTTNNSALFDPYFFIGIKGPQPLGQGQAYALNFAMEWSFDITFRGTRQQ